MPPWLQQLLTALGAFVGGRVVATVGERMRESKELRRSVDRLALAVEQVPTQINNLQAEIHRVGARNEAQMEGIRAELHHHKLEQEQRFSSLEDRIDATAGRLDGLASAPPPPPSPFLPRQRMNWPVDQDPGFYKPPTGEDLET
jgi:TolA-binding protein